ATALLMAGILVFGLASFALLPIAALPNVDFPTIVVTTNLPGASPETMASSVATPLEQQFAAIPALAQMSSTSGLGSTVITMQFNLNRNIDAAAQDVQAAINAASGLLPKNLPSPPKFRKTNPANRSILIYAVSSDAMPIQDTDQYAYNVLAESLSRIDGVSEVNIAGEQIPAIHVQVNPDALASRGISLEDVRTALLNATTNSPKGNLEGKQQQYTLATNDQLFTPDSFRHIIAAYRNGAPVQIKDIGDVIASSHRRLV
ncbi:MAG TPA: efflux RND transporter permease subunit, partial [Ktedonobacterales bacterium]|nr:efflux RND transporter permease subunit [Ktedonobacterales bacterium]